MQKNGVLVCTSEATIVFVIKFVLLKEPIYPFFTKINFKFLCLQYEKHQMYLRSRDLYFSKLVIEKKNLELNRKKNRYYIYEQKLSRVEIKVIARAERLAESKKSSSFWDAV